MCAKYDTGLLYRLVKVQKYLHVFILVFKVTVCEQISLQYRAAVDLLKRKQKL